MIIPNSEKNIKQMKSNLFLLASILTILILVNVTIFFKLILTNSENIALTVQTNDLSTEVTEMSDLVNNLSAISDIKGDEIDTLKVALEDSNNYLDEKLVEIEEVQSYMSQIIETFNENTQSDIEVPISRSFSRSEDDSSFFDPIDVSNREFETILEEDPLSTILNSQAENYSILAEEIQSQMEFLECRPDAWPAQGTLSSVYGYRDDPVYGGTALHSGQDIANVVGTEVSAAGSGVVTFSGYDGQYGNVITINHGYGYSTAYAHNSELIAEVGDYVEKGQLISLMGSTGKSTGSHLHFEIRFNGTAIDPLTILN